jgi:tRNA 2-selenouridine synthase
MAAPATSAKKMKYPGLLSFAALLQELDLFDAIIDVRSPGEFSEDHIPGAINLPVLDNSERERIGTLYKQTGPFEAKRAGAALVAKNIGKHIEHSLNDKPRNWKSLVYCWRGGNRSGAMAHILAKIGWPAIQLDGGYREYRRHVSAALAEMPSRFSFRVVCGPTGSGKSRLLQTLQKHGAQVLDLEHLAAHRGSVLGHLPSEPQPSQKAFESRIWDTLRKFDADQVVFVEAESKKVGALHVPDALMERMRASACVSLTLSKEWRIRLLMDDYSHFVLQPETLNRQLEHLVPLHGRDAISAWQAMAIDGNIGPVVEQLLDRHYDPAYSKSIGRNFSFFGQALPLSLSGIDTADFESAASYLIQQNKKAA